MAGAAVIEACPVVKLMGCMGHTALRKPSSIKAIDCRGQSWGITGCREKEKGQEIEDRGKCITWRKRDGKRLRGLKSGECKTNWKLK